MKSLTIASITTFATAWQTRIVGGSETTPVLDAFMTALLQRGISPSSGQFGEASLAAPQWVLTAGRCMKRKPVAPQADN